MTKDYEAKHYDASVDYTGDPVTPDPNAYVWTWPEGWENGSSRILEDTDDLTITLGPKYVAQGTADKPARFTKIKIYDSTSPGVIDKQAGPIVEWDWQAQGDGTGAWTKTVIIPTKDRSDLTIAGTATSPVLQCVDTGDDDDVWFEPVVSAGGTDYYPDPEVILQKNPDDG